ncbi:unnamed protein product [Ixodes pacificus]
MELHYQRLYNVESIKRCAGNKNKKTKRYKIPDIIEGTKKPKTKMTHQKGIQLIQVHCLKEIYEEVGCFIMLWFWGRVVVT